MLTADEQWLHLVDAFSEASVNPDKWYGALDQFARATGSQAGQLVGLGSERAAPFNLWTGDPLAGEEFLTLGFDNPTRNPRVQAGSRVSELIVLADADIITPHEAKRNEQYRWARHHDIPYICLSPLLYADQMMVGVAVCRSEKAGHITGEQRRIFTSLVPHIRAAVKTQILLEGHTASILSGAMEAMSMAAFISDHSGKITGMTPRAEAIVTGNTYLSLKGGFLEAELPEDNIAITHAIQAAASGLSKPDKPLLQSLFIRSVRAPREPVIVDVVSLPAKAYSFGFGARALVVVRGQDKQNSHLASALQTAFSLTVTESEIALLLADGKTPEAIAGLRGVSVATVRTQTKQIYQKLGVTRQIELVARLRQS